MENWHTITLSTFAHEIEALEFVRTGLGASSQAYANFTFIGLDGSLNEVDLLVIGPWGFFLCEIKSRPGVVRGDSQTWRWVDGSRVFSADNPLLLTQRKCQKLKSLLQKQRALRDVQVPFLEPVVFLSHSSNTLDLPPDARQRVFLRDTPARPGIRAALNQRQGEGLKPFTTPPIARPQLSAVLRAITELGLKPKSSARQVGDYELGRLLYESPAHTVQDWEATHVTAKAVPRLARLYLIDSVATADDRERLAKAARKDFELIEPLDHPGLLRAETMVSSERGPAVIYRYPTGARRLDHFLAEKGESLSITDRLSLLRQVAEAIAYAHDHRVIHRGLTPQSILVSEVDGQGLRAQIYNWQLGSGLITQTAGPGTRSLHATDLLEDASTAYLAPETISGVNLDAPEIDSFSLGALAFRLFTDQPPARSALELSSVLREEVGGGLDVASVKDGLPRSLVELIGYSTNPDASVRYTAREFVQQLDEVEDELTRPEPRHVQDPRTARPGDEMEGGLRVLRRLGSGSVSVVFLVQSPEHKEPHVLKLAAQPDYNNRLRTEYETVRKLVHPGVVRATDLFSSGGIDGILMECAVEVPREWLTDPAATAETALAEASGSRRRYSESETLAVRLRRFGRLEIDLLQAFGSDLLEALEYVHQSGLVHRDVKPDNIGIRLPRSKERLRLVLFDFSLANAPLDEIRLGTPPYLDPFLPLRKIKRWDSQAERFSAAMTLYEMAAGALPKWGDGRSAPHLIDEEVNLQQELFIPDLREKLAEFFSRALRRDHAKRFDTWQQMRAAWTEVFEDVDKPVVPPRPPTEDAPTPKLDDLVATATTDTQLVHFGLSTRAFNALERLRLVTVGDLLSYPLAQVYQMQGVGNKTRRELTDLVRLLRQRFGDVTPTGPSITPLLDATVGGSAAASEVDPDAQSIDLIARQVVVRRAGNKGSSENAAIERFLGDDAPPEAPWQWRNQSECAATLGVTRARVGQIIDKARDRWVRLPALTSVRHEIERLLRRGAGVMTHRELIRAVLAARGSAFDEPERTRLSSQVVRAAVETEKGLESPRFVEVRRNHRVFVALDRSLADWVLALAERTDALLTESPDALPSRARTIEALQGIPRPPFPSDAECPPADAGRLLDLATAVAQVARTNARLELYPTGLPAARSLLLCRTAFFHTGALGLDDLRQRVTSRFPEAEPLPNDPAALGSLFRSADIPLRWSADALNGVGGFVSTMEHESLLTLTEKSSHRLRTRTESIPMPAVPEAIADALLLEDKLRSCAKNGSFLVLSVPPPRLRRAEKELLARFQVDRVDGDALFLQHLRELATEYEIPWDTILNADAAAPGSEGQKNLQRLIDMIRPKLRRDLISTSRTHLLVNPGLFARYGLMGLLAELRDDVGRTDGPHGLWILIPAVVQSSLPKLNGQPVPIIAHHQYLTLPDAWLDNLHRTAAATTT